jgi:hypothetical protein
MSWRYTVNNYIYASTIIFVLLALIWNGKTWPNLFIKATLLFMGVAGIVLSLTALGYITRVPK